MDDSTPLSTQAAQIRLGGLLFFFFKKEDTKLGGDGKVRMDLRGDTEEVVVNMIKIYVCRQAKSSKNE